MLCDHKYYTEVYGGKTVSEEDFPRFCDIAESAVAMRVACPLTEVELVARGALEQTKNCLCELCDLYADSAQRNGVKSVSTDGMSLSLGADPASSRKLAEVIGRRLFRTGLLYRGITLC